MAISRGRCLPERSICSSPAANCSVSGWEGAPDVRHAVDLLGGLEVVEDGAHARLGGALVHQLDGSAWLGLLSVTLRLFLPFLPPAAAAARTAPHAPPPSRSRAASAPAPRTAPGGAGPRR